MTGLRLIDVLTDDEIQRAAEIWAECAQRGASPHVRLVKEIVAPKLYRIQRIVGHEFTADKIAYEIEDVFNKARHSL